MEGDQSESSRSDLNLSSSSLPSDLAFNIISLLEDSDVCSLGSCSRFWRDLCASDSVWIALYNRRWPSAVGDLAASPSQGFRALYINKHKKMSSAVSAIVKFVEDCSQSGSLEVGYYLKAISDLGSLELGFRDVQLFLFRRDQNVLLNLIGLHYCMFLLNLPVLVTKNSILPSSVYLKENFEFLCKSQLLCLVLPYATSTLKLGTIRRIRGVNPVDVMEVIESCQVSKRQVCVSWFMLGRWFYGFRLPDEHRSRTVSLIELAVGKEEEVLGVLNRGAIHEVLRVQITRLATTAT